MLMFSDVFSQETIRIEFYKEATGDHDLMINNYLNLNGYSSFVNYGNNKTKTDYILKYTTTSRTEYDELHKYSITLLDSNQNIINEVKKTIPYVNAGVNEPKQICQGLNKLFYKRFNCKHDIGNKKVKYFNISFIVHKIDSCTYSIVAKGAGVHPLKNVEDAFLNKATQYLTSFDYYFEGEKYKYIAPGPMITVHNGYMVLGIIKGTVHNIDGPQKLNEKPSEFIREF